MKIFLEKYLSSAQPDVVAVARPAELKTASRRDPNETIISKVRRV